MTRVNVDLGEVSDAFRIARTVHGDSVEQAIQEACQLYVKKYGSERTEVTFKVVKNPGKNLLTFIIETELQDLCGELLRCEKKQASKAHVNKIRSRMIQLVKKNPVISEKLADEIQTVLKAVKP